MLPLSHLTVLDLSRHLPGPLAARLLADLGARVIKVEEPRAGDPVRMAPPFAGEAGSLASLLLGGLESVSLDLKSAEAREALLALVDRADVLLESFRPGTLERLGLAPERLRARNPRLIVASVSGWGQNGPWRGRAGHDLTYQAVGGSLAATGRTPAVPVADVVGAWSVVTAILAQLLARERDGETAWLDASLFDAAVHANVTGWASEANRAHGVGEALPLTGALPCYRVYTTSDGARLAVACLERPFWERFCRAAGREDLIPRQLDGSIETRREVAAVVAARSRGEWESLLAGLDVPVEAVHALAETEGHPQTRDRELVGRAPDGTLRVRFPVRFDGERPRAAGRLPAPGEHTEDVLREAGVAAADLPEHRRKRLGIGPRPRLRDRALRWWLRRRR